MKETKSGESISGAGKKKGISSPNNDVIQYENLKSLLGAYLHNLFKYFGVESRIYFMSKGVWSSSHHPLTYPF